MISKYMWIVLLLSVAFCACSRSKGTDNFLVLSSMDGEQVSKVDAQKAQVFWATEMDTSINIPYDDISWHIVELLPKHSGVLQDSSSFVIMINTVSSEAEGKPSLKLYGQFDRGRLTKVYYTEAGEGLDTWIAVETYLALVREDGRPRVKLDVVLETIGFGLSCYVRHPYNKSGGYDAIHHYMRIHAEFDVPEDVFKFLGKAAEPDVKQID